MIRRPVCVLIGALATQACVAENSDFLGPGFDDPVDADDPHPVWDLPTAASRWSIGVCDPQEGDDDANWRVGIPGDCTALGYDGLLDSAVSGAVLQTVPIPAAGTVTLTMSTRVSLPICDGKALAGARIVAQGEGLSTPLIFDSGQVPEFGATGPVLGGSFDWRDVVASFEVPEPMDVTIAFGILVGDSKCLRFQDSGTPCALKPDAGPGCDVVLSCCESAFAALEEPEGWQFDDVQLTIDP